MVQCCHVTLQRLPTDAKSRFQICQLSDCWGCSAPTDFLCDSSMCDSSLAETPSGHFVHCNRAVWQDGLLMKTCLCSSCLTCCHIKGSWVQSFSGAGLLSNADNVNYSGGMRKVRRSRTVQSIKSLTFKGLKLVKMKSQSFRVYLTPRNISVHSFWVLLTNWNIW